MDSVAMCDSNMLEVFTITPTLAELNATDVAQNLLPESTVPEKEVVKGDVKTLECNQYIPGYKFYDFSRFNAPANNASLNTPPRSRNLTPERDDNLNLTATIVRRPPGLENDNFDSAIYMDSNDLTSTFEYIYSPESLDNDNSMETGQIENSMETGKIENSMEIGKIERKKVGLDHTYCSDQRSPEPAANTTTSFSPPSSRSVSPMPLSLSDSNSSGASWTIAPGYDFNALGISRATTAQPTSFKNSVNKKTPSTARKNKVKKNSPVYDEKKKEIHNQKERERRLALNDSYDDLKQVVPELKLQPKVSNAMVLKKAKEYIFSLLELENEKNWYVEENKRLQAKVANLKIQQIQYARNEPLKELASIRWNPTMIRK